MKIKINLGVLAFVLTTNTYSSILDLEEVDYLAAGDGLITYDKSTGLEWLDLTVTQGFSMLEVEANASIWVDGWQWATIAQMQTMFDHASDYNNSFEEPLIAYPIADILGPTVTNVQPGEYITKYALGFSREFLFDTQLYEYGYDYGTARIKGGINLDTSDPWYPYLPFPLCDDPCATFTLTGWRESDTDPNYGAWLVREASVVPEPSILVLIGLGLAGIGFARRKKS